MLEKEPCHLSTDCMPEGSSRLSWSQVKVHSSSDEITRRQL